MSLRKGRHYHVRHFDDRHAAAAAIAITITSITKNSIDIGNFTNVII